MILFFWRNFFFLLIIVSFSGCSILKNDSAPAEKLTDFNPTVKVVNIYNARLHYQTENLFFPVFVNNKFVLNVDKQTLVMFSARDSHFIWQKSFTNNITSKIIYAKNKIFVSTYKKVYALDAKNGDLIWVTTVKSKAHIIGYHNVLVISTGFKLQGLSVDSGEVVWSYKHKVNKVSNIRITTRPIISGKYVFSVYRDNKLICIDAKTGKSLWKKKLLNSVNKNDNGDIIKLYNLKDIICIATKTDELIAFKVSNGAILWVGCVPGVKSISYDKKNIYLVDRQDRIWAFKKNMGTLCWQILSFLNRKISTPVVVINKYLVFADKDGYIHWLNKFNGKMAARTYLQNVYGAKIVLYKNKQYVFASNGELSVFKLIALNNSMKKSTIL